MKITAVTCAVLLAIASSVSVASAACQECPAGYTHSHETGTCVPKTVSS